MRNGVLFRLALVLPKQSVAAWKKLPIRDERSRIPGTHEAHEGGRILGSELGVSGVKTLKAALEKLDEAGLTVEKKDVASWEKAEIDGEEGVRIETKGALKPDATVQKLLSLLKKQVSDGEEFTQVERDGKDGEVEVFGYLSGYDALSDHFLPLTMLGAAAGRAGGSGSLVFLGDVELTDVAVMVRATFSEAGVELVEYPDPQDVTDVEARAISDGFGARAESGVTDAYQRWLDKFEEKKARRLYAGRVGWLRPDGTYAIEPRFRSAGNFSEDLAAVALEGPFDYGYVDRSGKEVIAYRFFSARAFHQGRALVQPAMGRHGFIDRSGELVIPDRYDHAEDFAEERAVVGVGTLRGYVDLAGNEIAPAKYQTARSFTDGLALVAEHGPNQRGGFGFLDRDGRVAVPLALENASVFHQGYALASRNSLWGFLDRSGKFLFPPRYLQCGYLVEGRALAQLDGKWGVVDARGEVVLPHAHAVLRDHFEWYVATSAEGSTFFSKQGVEAFRVPYTNIGELRDGHMTVSNGYAGPYGYMNREGRVVLPPRFRFAAPFSGGRAIVQFEDENWGIIDLDGKAVHTFDFSLLPSCGASRFADDGIAYIESFGRFGLVDRDGKLIRPPEFQELYGFGDEQIWVRCPENFA